jgi:membrane protease YdiL (CAAX protease family)
MATQPVLPTSAQLSPAFRWGSAAEFLLGASIVIAYNVYHRLYNEVPILFVLALLSFRLRDGNWGVLGLKRPASWRNTILIALAAAALRLLLGEFVIDPLTAHFWHPAIAPSEAASITHNLKYALMMLGLVWTFAAFGEEISYRSYLLTRAADIGGRSALAYWIALIPMSVLFGLGHYYKGPSGMVDSGIAGLILGVAYLLSGKNLWVAVLAHGFIDTFGIVVLYFGWQS